MSAHPAAQPASSQSAALKGFDLFWSRYPSKFHRAQAQAVWADLHPTAAQQEAFLGALTIEAGDRERARLRGQSLPAQTAAVWLVEHRFIGEPETVLTAAARALRHAWHRGHLIERESTARRVAARALQLVFTIAFPVTMAAMLVHGWTAP